MHKHKLALRARQTNLSSTLELTAGSMEEYLAPALVFLDAGLDPMEIVLALDDEIDDRTDGVQSDSAEEEDKEDITEEQDEDEKLDTEELSPGVQYGE